MIAAFLFGALPGLKVARHAEVSLRAGAQDCVSCKDVVEHTEKPCPDTKWWAKALTAVLPLQAAQLGIH